MRIESDKMIKVLLVDDHRLLREGLSAMLATAGNIEVCGSLKSGEEAVSQVSVLKPDVILMDIIMGGMTGIEATRWVKEQNNSTKVILISSEIRKELIQAGIQSGIDGYLPKDVGKATLVEAIQAVVNGGRFFNEAITSLVFEDFYHKTQSVSPTGKITCTDELTKRENEILACLAAGKANREIADELFISVKTVDSHRSHILEKLGLKNNAELVRYAVKNNLINLD
jgi:DNA-binding NarL/FixJ family response regulator